MPAEVVDAVVLSLMFLLVIGVAVAAVFAMMGWILYRAYAAKQRQVRLPVDARRSADNPFPELSGRVDTSYTTFRDASISGSIMSRSQSASVANFHGRFSLPAGPRPARRGELTLQYPAAAGSQGWVKVALDQRHADFWGPAGFGARLHLDDGTLTGEDGRRIGEWDMESRHRAEHGALYRRVVIGQREVFLCDYGGGSGFSTASFLVVGQLQQLSAAEAATLLGLVVVLRGVLPVRRGQGALA